MCDFNFSFYFFFLPYVDSALSRDFASLPQTLNLHVYVSWEPVWAWVVCVSCNGLETPSWSMMDGWPESCLCGAGTCHTHWCRSRLNLVALVCGAAAWCNNICPPSWICWAWPRAVHTWTSYHLLISVLGLWCLLCPCVCCAQCNSAPRPFRRCCCCLSPRSSRYVLIKAESKHLSAENK